MYNIFLFSQTSKKGVQMSEKTAKYIIISLCVATFVVMILFSIHPSLSFFGDKKDIGGSIVVGQANFEFVNDLPLFLDLQNFSGGKIEQEVAVINARNKEGSDTTNLVDCFLRFKVDASSSVVSQVDSTKFLKNGDYYYLKTIFSVGQTQQLISSFSVQNPSEEEYLNGISVAIDVDVMQATKSLIAETFVDAPQEWIDLF